MEMERTRSVRSRRARTYLPATDSRSDFVGFAKTVKDIEAFLQGHSGTAALKSPDGSERPIPHELFEILEQVATALANGNGVTVAPYGMQLTTQEGADYLGISRPTLVKLLEAGEIPHEKRGRHRRVTLRDLVEYQDRSRVERRDALRLLAREGQSDEDITNAGIPVIDRGPEV